APRGHGVPHVLSGRDRKGALIREDEIAILELVARRAAVFFSHGLAPTKNRRPSSFQSQNAGGIAGMRVGDGFSYRAVLYASFCDMSRALTIPALNRSLPIDRRHRPPHVALEIGVRLLHADERLAHDGQRHADRKLIARGGERDREMRRIAL